MLRLKTAIRTQTSRRDRTLRAGTLYVGVLFTALIVGLVGLTGVTVAQLSLVSATKGRSAGTAQQLAKAAVEEGIRQLTTTPAWRTTFSNNTLYPATPQAMGDGTISWKFVDADGNLNDDLTDSIRVYGIGRSGTATYVESVELLPTDSPLTCLEASFHCAGDITLNSYCDFTTNQFVSSNGNILVSGNPSQIMGSAQAVGTVTGSVTLGSMSGITPRQMPGDSVFDYYLANGTWIDINNIPLVSTVRTISKKVLSPKIREYGAGKNAEGIYVIDCKGQNLKIENVRIVGTLVIINPGATCLVSQSVCWDPVSYNFPALMVRGNCQFVFNQNQLDETLLATNYNITGAPYEGVEDTDTSDKYPSRIKGLVYVSDKITFKSSSASAPLFDGCVVCSSVLTESTGDAKFSYRPTHLHYPPPGFTLGSKMTVLPGTWTRASL